MAATLITDTQNYVGSAAERAAMSTAGVKAGSKFYETDTKLTYIWNASAWVLFAPASLPGSGAKVFATFTDGDTTPSIAGGDYFKTANTNPTTITDFEDPASGGHEITIDFGDANTTIEASANIRMQGGVTSPTNDFGPSQDGVTMTLYYNGTQWREKSRSVNV